jgi:hypothetical protein
MTESGARLAFSLTSTPDMLAPATAADRRKGLLQITAALDVPAGSGRILRCRSITVAIPTGTAPGRLTSQPECINTGFRSPRGWWHVSRNTTDPEAAVFRLRPQNPRQEAVFDDTARVTLVLDRIPLTTESGTVDIRITAETADPAAGAGVFARAGTVLPLVIGPAAPGSASPAPDSD